LKKKKNEAKIMRMEKGGEKGIALNLRKGGGKNKEIFKKVEKQSDIQGGKT